MHYRLSDFNSPQFNQHLHHQTRIQTDPYNQFPHHFLHSDLHFIIRHCMFFNTWKVCQIMCLLMHYYVFAFRSCDPHIKNGYLFNISLRHEHNHRLSCAAALQKRDVSTETIEKLKLLFESGHSPSSALDTIKYDLQDQEGDDYIYAAADRSICPDLQFCFRSETC